MWFMPWWYIRWYLASKGDTPSVVTVVLFIWFIHCVIQQNINYNLYLIQTKYITNLERRQIPLTWSEAQRDLSPDQVSYTPLVSSFSGTPSITYSWLRPWQQPNNTLTIEFTTYLYQLPTRKVARLYSRI